MAEKILNEFDLQSATWKKLSAFLEQRLAEHRKRNDHDQPDGDTAKLRGRIAEDKFILDLGRDKPAPVKEVGDAAVGALIT